MLLRAPMKCRTGLGSVRSLSDKKVFFSGIQPTGVPHLGNYFGFIKNWIAIQKENPKVPKYMAVVDLHAITTSLPDPVLMKENIVKMTASLLACGVDPAETVLFQQSQVPQHSELCWILGSFQTVTQLQRLPQYKDKSKKYKKGQAPIGLVSYPVLQAADVLLYKGTHVPVGEDQSQHMNLLIDLAEHFNLRFKINHFPIPQMVSSPSPRIKSLRAPENKMSKSDPSHFSRLEINDTSELVVQKIRKALTDTTPTITYDWQNRPGISNLVSIYSAFTQKSPDVVVEESRSLDTLAFKNKLIEVAEAEIGPIRRRYSELMQDEGYVWNILRIGSEGAKEVAAANLDEVKRIVGFK